MTLEHAAVAIAPAKQKSENALRTIGEVSQELALPAHVLRFWESKFTQIKPQKRRGGHRYYRREDMETIRAIKSLLYDRGFTIKGAQKYLKEQRKFGDSAITLPEQVSTAVTAHVATPPAANTDAPNVASSVVQHTTAQEEASKATIEPLIKQAEKIRDLLRA